MIAQPDKILDQYVNKRGKDRLMHQGGIQVTEVVRQKTHKQRECK